MQADVGRVDAADVVVPTIPSIRTDASGSVPENHEITLQAEADELPETIGTLHCHENNDGYTFMCTTEVGGTSRPRSRGRSWRKLKAKSRACKRKS